MTQSTLEKLAGIETVSRDISTDLLATRSEVASLETVTSRLYGNACLVRDDVQQTQTLISVSSRHQQTQLEHITGQNSRQDQQIKDIAHTLQGLVRHLGIDDDVDLRRPKTQAQTFRRLMEKPSKTREICDDLGGRYGIQRPLLAPRDKWRAPPDLASEAQLVRVPPGDSSNYPVCICNKSKHHTSSLSVTTIGSFIWRSERMYHGHWPSCPFAGIGASGGHHRAFGVKYIGLAWMLKYAVEISFASSHGAGGWSLCPQVRFRPTIDERTDPVFRILDLLEKAVWALPYEKERSSYTRECVEFLSQCQVRIFQLFQEKRAANMATNSQNETMAHKFAKITLSLRLKQVSSYSSLVLGPLHTWNGTLIYVLGFI